MSTDPAGGESADEADPTVEMAEQAALDEPELDRGLIEAWAAKMISNPDRAYRATFYVATIFFLVTTLFPFYWLARGCTDAAEQPLRGRRVPSGGGSTRRRSSRSSRRCRSIGTCSTAS